jgi:class 3 adenylate cyclase/ABC-type uncharacterized transport system auxiliary subunit
LLHSRGAETPEKPAPLQAPQGRATQRCLVVAGIDFVCRAKAALRRVSHPPVVRFFNWPLPAIIVLFPRVDLLCVRSLIFAREKSPATGLGFNSYQFREQASMVVRDPSPAQPLEMAHVLFMDIVAYSTLPMDHQRQVLHELQEAVRKTPEFVRAQSEGQLLRLPTGDGMALVFFGDPQAPVRCALELSRALRDRPTIKVRMGIHTGPVYRVADINANQNVSGGGINVAQRVMDCGDAGHILVSAAAAEVLGQLSDWSGKLHDLGEAEVKHKVRLHIFNLCTDDTGNSCLPKKFAVPKSPNDPKGLKGETDLTRGATVLPSARIEPLASGRSRWYRRPRILLLGGVAFLILTAVGLVAYYSGWGASPPYKYYELEVPATAAASGTPYPITILVDQVSVPQLYQDNRILYGAGAIQFSAYEHHRWAELPSEMIQHALISVLRGTGQYRSVAAVSNNARGDYVIRGELRTLYEVDQPEPAGRFAIEIELLDKKNGMTALSYAYAHDEPVEGKSVGDVVQALNRNVLKGMQQIAGNLNQYFVNHPPQQEAAQ